MNLRMSLNQELVTIDDAALESDDKHEQLNRCTGNYDRIDFVDFVLLNLDFCCVRAQAFASVFLPFCRS